MIVLFLQNGFGLSRNYVKDQEKKLFSKERWILSYLEKAY
jgi:hypothetical protein